MKKGKFFILFAIIFVFALVFPIERAAPRADNFVTQSGKSVSYDKLISSSKTILVVWTSWCPSCRVAISNLTKKCTPFGNVKLLYINTAEKKSTVTRFLKTKRLKQCARDAIILDRDGVVARRFSVFSIPAFIFLKKGEFVHKSNFLNRDLVDEIFGSR